jgi:hypothetical protein
MRTFLAIAIAAGAAACTPVPPGPGPGPGARYAATDVPAATPIGPPRDCLRLLDIERTKVWNDHVIDFVMKNHSAFRNVLPGRCPNLGAYERFSYHTTIGQLCSVDVITVQDPAGNNGASCGLGAFQPIAPTVPGD